MFAEYNCYNPFVNSKCNKNEGVRPKKDLTFKKKYALRIDSTSKGV